MSAKLAGIRGPTRAVLGGHNKSERVSGGGAMTRQPSPSSLHAAARFPEDRAASVVPRPRPSMDDRLPPGAPVPQAARARRSSASDSVPSPRLPPSFSFQTTTDEEAVLNASLPAPMAVDSVGASASIALTPSKSAMVVDENPQHVAEYRTDILDLLFAKELTNRPRANYMDMQRNINGKMRAILIDWLDEVHLKYKLRVESLFLAVNLIDRYLSIKPVSRSRLQLVGVVGMFIATKFEEIHPPELQDFVYITDNAYTKEDVMAMERSMLVALDYQIAVPTPAHFLETLRKANRCDNAHGQLVQYILELALLDMCMLSFTPSQQVAAALLLSNELMDPRGELRQSLWPAEMALASHHAEDDLRVCAEQMRVLLQNAPRSTLRAIQTKYASKERCFVADLLLW